MVFIRDTLAPRLGVRVDTVEATAQREADARGLHWQERCRIYLALSKAMGISLNLETTQA